MRLAYVSKDYPLFKRWYQNCSHFLDSLFSHPTDPAALLHCRLQFQIPLKRMLAAFIINHYPQPTNLALAASIYSGVLEEVDSISANK